MNRIWKISNIEKRRRILILCAICSAYALTAEFFVSDFADIMQQEQLYLYKVMECINNALNGKRSEFFCFDNRNFIYVFCGLEILLF